MSPWLIPIVFALAILLGGVVIGYGPLLALAPSPGDSGEAWVEVQRIEADSSNGPNMTVTVTYHTGGPGIEPAQTGTHQFITAGVNPVQVDADGNWAYLRKSTLPTALVEADGDHAAGVQTVGPWVLVGNLSTATEIVGSSPVTVVAPAAMDVDPARKAHFLSKFVSPYQLHPIRGDAATILIAPASLSYDGATYGTTGYVTQHAFWDGQSASVWIHEYIHTQQAFETAEGMQWFREASATYFSARMLEEQYQGVSHTDVLIWIEARDNFDEATLSQPSTWQASNANYFRGAKLLYSVDAAIRSGSDGKYTLVAVFREMNGREDPVTVGEFVRIVESYSGQQEPWLRHAMTESGPITDQVPAKLGFNSEWPRAG